MTGPHGTATQPVAEASPTAIAWLRERGLPYYIFGRYLVLTPAMADRLPERLRPAFR